MSRAPHPESYGLPAYLGLGRYHHAYRRKDVVRATYRIEGETTSLYYARIGADRCRLVEFWDGATLSDIHRPLLENAFFHGLVSLPTWEHPRFEWLIRRVTTERNIYMAYATKPTFFFFPAGIIFRLRQPLTKANRNAWESLKGRLEHLGKTAPLRFEHKHAGVVLKWSESSGVSIEEVDLLDFSALLVNVIAATDLLWESGIVPAEKEHSLGVVDSMQSGHDSLTLRPGVPERGFQTFTVCSFDDGVPPLLKLKQDFATVSRRALQAQTRLKPETDPMS